MSLPYDAVLFDLYGTLVDAKGDAIYGAQSLLETLEGARWAIVTSCRRDVATKLIANAGLATPPLLIASDDVVANKPAPEGYLLAARRLAVEPQRTLVVEDSVAGLSAGIAAGMDVVMVLRGRAPELARKATFSVADLAELKLGAVNGAVELQGF